jgi:DNA-binding MarR family transcriptional regulator
MKSTLPPVLPCLCSSFRRASRALTQLYEQALRPLGLRATQFTILQVLARAGDVTQRQMGEMLAMDSTTLTRTLAIMTRQGWILEHRGKDRRQRWLRLAKRGEAQLQRASPVWEQVQSEMRRSVGDQVWENLFRVSNQVTNAAMTQGESL